MLYKTLRENAETIKIEYVPPTVYDPTSLFSSILTSQIPQVNVIVPPLEPSAPLVLLVTACYLHTSA